MYQISHLTTRLISILSNIKKFGLILLISTIQPVAFSNPINLNGYELVDIYLDGPDSNVSLLNTENDTLTVLRQGQSIVGCTLDFVESNQASFYCGNQIYSLSFNNYESAQAQNAELSQESALIEVSVSEQFKYFDYPENFITDFNLLPTHSNGYIVGYTIQNLPDQVIAQRLGLERGDLIVNINGIYASNPEEFSNAFEQLATANTVDMELLRNNQNLYRTYLLNRDMVTTCY
ncbi:MAG: hypothetical protein AAGB35_08145 [Pseudomonadota bacterium]